MFPRRAITLAVLLAVSLAGCTLNAGSKFAEQYEAYLKTVPDVASFQIRGNNNLPANGSADSRVTLVDGLSDADVASVIHRIAAHRSDQKISEHHLTVFFSAVNSGGDPAQVSLYLEPTSTAGVDDEARLLERVQGVTALAAASAGLTELAATVNQLRATTSGDPFDLADQLVDYLGDDTTGVKYVAVNTDDNGALSFDVGDPVDELRPITELLAAIPDGIAPRRWWATSQLPAKQPRFEVTLPQGTDESVKTSVEAKAAELGVSVKVVIAA